MVCQQYGLPTTTPIHITGCCCQRAFLTRKTSATASRAWMTLKMFTAWAACITDTQPAKIRTNDLAVKPLLSTHTTAIKESVLTLLYMARLTAVTLHTEHERTVATPIIPGAPFCISMHEQHNSLATVYLCVLFCPAHPRPPHPHHDKQATQRTMIPWSVGTSPHTFSATLRLVFGPAIC